VHAPSITPAKAISDSALLEPYFRGPSWQTWRAILRAAYCEPLSDDELALFRAVAGGRDPPSTPVKELIVIAGRRSGKDSIASAIASAAACVDYRPDLRPGERASILCLAVDREQARIVHRYIAGYFREIPLLQPLLQREDDESLLLANGVEIVIATNSFRSVRGRTIACAILDEAAFWRDEDFANPDTEVYNAIRPGMVTLPNAILVIITTAYRKAGLACNKYVQYYGKPDDNVLVVYGPSTTFNPSLPQSIIDDALRDDPEAASAEWLSIWRSDISDLFDRETIEAAIDHGITVRPPRPAIRYHAFADPSGGRGDSFCCAVSSAEPPNRVLVDLVFERRAPFDPSPVVAEIAEILRQYNVYELVGDNYGAEWVVEAFAKHGVRYVVSERNRSKVYLDAIPLFAAGRARLLENHRAARQLISLERRTSRSGKDTVNHPPQGADDCANAVCGALVLAAQSSIPALWRSQDLKQNGQAYPWPLRATGLFAAVTTDEFGVFSSYWAIGADRYPLGRGAPFGPRLLLIDYHRSPMHPRLFDRIGDHLWTLAKAGDHPVGVRGVIAPPELVPQAYAAGLVVLADATKLLEGSACQSLMLTAAAQIAAGNLKLTTLAEERALTLPLPLADLLRPDAPPTAAGDAVLLGIGGALPPPEKPRQWRGKALM
jgi:hypothetical protein